MPKPNKPGGQAGNKNALKHGLWARRTGDLGKVALDLKKEISYLEGLLEKLAQKLDRSMEDASRLSKADREDISILLFVVDRRITAVRSQAFISGELSEIEREIEEGLFLARTDLGILNYLDPPEQLARAPRKRSRAQL